LEKGKIDNYKLWETKLKEATRNKLEKQFELRKDLTWTKIMDESLEGADAYFGFLEEDCIIE